MEHPALDLFSMMCSQSSLHRQPLVLHRRSARTWPTWPAPAPWTSPVLEHHTFPLAQVNEALDTIPHRHGGFTNFLCVP